MHILPLWQHNGGEQPVDGETEISRRDKIADALRATGQENWI